jgi:hypothetical protein
MRPRGRLSYYLVGMEGGDCGGSVAALAGGVAAPEDPRVTRHRRRAHRGPTTSTWPSQGTHFSVLTPSCYSRGQRAHACRSSGLSCHLGVEAPR